MNIFLAFSCTILFALSVTALEPVQFLHLTDIHLDPFYISNSPADQKCREDDVKTSDRSYFGRHGCDSPEMLLELMLEKISLEHSSASFMVLSGDMVTHSLDDYHSPSKVIYDTVDEVSRYITKYFPNTMVLQGFGNNDALSHNQVPMPDEKEAFYSAYYTAFFESNAAYQTNLSDVQKESIKSTFLNGGYYNFPISEDLHIVVLNTNYWHSSNLLSNDEQTSNGQIEWFEKLIELLPENRQLILSGHIFPGIYYQDQQFWNETFVERFRDAVYSKHANIIGFIGGHTHYGDLRSVQNFDYGWLSNVFKDKGSLEPYVSIAVAPAISPIYLNNPGYRSIKLEADETNKLQYQSYKDCFLNLTRVVQNRQFRFRKARTSFQFCYNSTQFVTDLRPSTIAQFNEALYQDEELLKKYVVSKTGYDPSLPEERIEEIIDTTYESKQILAVPKNEWNSEFLCYSKYLLASEVSDCMKAFS